MAPKSYEEFDLARIDEGDELKRLLLLLHADNLLGTATADLLARSAGEDKDITNKLYSDYRELRRALLQFVADNHPAIAAETRIRLVQKLLDRLVFIAYAEDTVLLPDDRLKLAVDHKDPFHPRPKWDNVLVLFAAVDCGNKGLGITGYNGGLFATDPALDALALPDHLVENFLKLSAYDFRSEVSVTILGHLFEQTIGDIEADLLVARGEEPAGPGRKKRDGIVYTPDFVTRFIVEQTLGKVIDDIRARLQAVHVASVDADGNLVWNGEERAYWQGFIAALKALTIVDPACGSGHFLVAAFDYIAAVTKAANDRLRELDPLAAEDTAVANAHIITRTLYGVDLNAESVEITRLSLWLKTAQRDQPLTALDHNIRVGNSIIDDPAVHPRAFHWETAFAEIFAHGGFDLVLGNPPYVRMEHLKAFKPYLEGHYAVVSDRADLYAYFFELGVRLLKPGGRLGFISSSTFFRTGSGAPLRRYLAEQTAIETVVDFGDLQLFEGVTTYPAIVTLRRDAPADALKFLNIKAMPDDLGQVFAADARPMPQARLTEGGWRFESDRLDAIRAKMAAGRQTLAQVYGAPMRGIVTGLNEAFVLTRSQRDALIAADPGSADLLKPFLIGENLKRWHVESDDLWLIYTPKNRVKIDDYPAIRDHLLPFRARLEARATQQNWWELQQAQAAYEAGFSGPKTIWPHFQLKSAFSSDDHPYFLNNKCFFWPGDQPLLTAQLNAKATYFFLIAIARQKRGGYIEAEAQYVGALPFADFGADSVAVEKLSRRLTGLSRDLAALIDLLHNRLGDVSLVAREIAAFRQWPDMDFAALRKLLVKRCKTDIPVGERDAWEIYFTEKRAEVLALRAKIAAAEAAINVRVYALFGLDADDIAAIEAALAGQY